MTSLRGLKWMAGLPLLFSVLVLASACAQAAGPGGDAPASDLPGPAKFAPDDVALRVEYTGGFTPPAVLATRLPIVSVYGDGRVLTEGPVPAIYPGQALPNVQVQQISAADVNRLVTRAVAAGVGRDFDLGQPPVADVPSTKFTVLTDAGVKVTEAQALSESGADQTGLTGPQRAARAGLQDLLAALTDLPKTLGAGAVSESRPYVPTGIAAVASAWTKPADLLVGEPPEVAWPGPALPGESLGNGLDVGCVAVTGQQAEQVLAAASPAKSTTPWLSGGTRWTIVFRPLLPEETSCADLVP